MPVMAPQDGVGCGKIDLGFRSVPVDCLSFVFASFLGKKET